MVPTYWTSADIGISVNNNDLPNGGYTKVSVDAYYAPNPFANWTIFGDYVAPSSGDYTFRVRAMRTVPFNEGGVIGGNTSTVTQSSMKIQVVRL